MNTNNGSKNLDRPGQENSGVGSNTDQSGATEDVPQQKNEICTVLKNPRRREALKYLERNDGDADLSDLAEYLAARENGIEVVALSSTQRKRLYISLYQVHLPMMDDLGVLQFDKHRGTIQLADAEGPLFQHLHFDPNSNERASEDADATRLSSVRNRLSGFIEPGEK